MLSWSQSDEIILQPHHSVKQQQVKSASVCCFREQAEITQCSVISFNSPAFICLYASLRLSDCDKMWLIFTTADSFVIMAVMQSISVSEAYSGVISDVGVSPAECSKGSS